MKKAIILALSLFPAVALAQASLVSGTKVTVDLRDPSVPMPEMPLAQMGDAQPDDLIYKATVEGLAPTRVLSAALSCQAGPACPTAKLITENGKSVCLLEETVSGAALKAGGSGTRHVILHVGGLSKDFCSASDESREGVVFTLRDARTHAPIRPQSLEIWNLEPHS